jgi:hypothetical protein
LIISEKEKILCVGGLAVSVAGLAGHLTRPSRRAHEITPSMCLPGILQIGNYVSLYSRSPKTVDTFIVPDLSHMFEFSSLKKPEIEA